MAPEAARTAGPPTTRTRRSINRAKRTTRRGRSTPPRGGHESHGGLVRAATPVVADYRRLSALQDAGHGGDGRASGPQSAACGPQLWSGRRAGEVGLPLPGGAFPSAHGLR
jgi:hypothetical protein